MTLRRLRIGAAAIAIAAVVGSSAAAAPRWVVIPAGTADFHDTAVMSVGRLWFLRETSSGGYTIRSARLAGGRLVDWRRVSPNLGRGGWTYLRGGDRDLVFSTTSGGGSAPVLAVRLQPNGLVGDPVALGGAATPSASGAHVVQLRDRAVRIQGVSSGTGFATVLGVCCDSSGRVVALGSLPASVYALALLGVDRGGRLWLAWAPGRGGPRSQARIVELDPATLRPRGQPAMAPGFRGFVKIKALVCTDVCRLLLEGSVGRALKVASWAPGEGRAPTMRIPHRARCSPNCGSVIAARIEGSRLAVAYWSDASQRGYTIGTARADARGRNLRRVASIRLPAQLGPFVRALFLNSTPAGALGSDGFAALAFYSSGRRSSFRMALLPT